MSRLPLQTRDALADDGREVWDSITASRGAIVADEGHLIGPFNAWVTAPTIGGRLAELGAALRFESSIERRLLEVAIITVGAHWKAEFEWWAHSRMALHHGVSAEAVAAKRAVTVMYRPRSHPAEPMRMVLTAVDLDRDPPRVIGYELPGRGRRELRADRILKIETDEE